MEVNVRLTLRGEIRELLGQGRLAEDPQLGEVLRVGVEDDSGGAPEFVLPLDSVERPETLDLRAAARLRLFIDIDTGKVRAEPL